MPSKWVEPEVFLEHKGVKVYHTYKDGDVAQRLTYFYTTSPDENDAWHVFDVRDVPYPYDRKVSVEAHHQAVIRYGLDSGEIPTPGDGLPGECVVKLANGRKVCCPAFPKECNYVRVTDKDGEELAYYDVQEWTDEPAEVMGAIMGAMAGGTRK